MSSAILAADEPTRAAAGDMWRMNFGTAGRTKNPLQIR